MGDRYAESFAKWQMVQRLDLPLIILLGGATGVGKSTIATMLANRLGITRVIPTDAVREVMRSMFTADLFPSLHTSSFDAARLVRHPLPRSADPVIIGFREQVSAVAVGIEALVSRAVSEGTDLIVEGAHVVPGFFDLARFENKAVVVPLVVTVDEVELHRSHFVQRSHDSRNRPAERYLDSFQNIRKMHRYVRSLALQHNVAIVPSYNLDATLSQVIDLVVGQAFKAVPDRTGPGPLDADTTAEDPHSGGGAAESPTVPIPTRRTRTAPHDAERGGTMSIAPQALERSVLESKERDELAVIAEAMGVKPSSRASKATLIDSILRQAGIETPEERPRRTRATKAAAATPAATTETAPAPTPAGSDSGRRRVARLRRIRVRCGGADAARPGQ